MKNLKLKHGLVALISAALVAAFTVATPSIAQASQPTCTTSNKVETCTGTDDNGAKYEIRMPAKFNGTLFVYSHGIRYGVAIPANPAAGTPAVPINYAPEFAPTQEVASALLAQVFPLA